MALRNPPGRRSFLGRREAIIVAAALLACAGLLFLRSCRAVEAAQAKIFLDGEVIREINLREKDDYRIDLLPEHGVPVAFEVKEGAIRFVDVTCPDHVCERAGYLSLSGQTAACMPNRVVLLIE